MDRIIAWRDYGERTCTCHGTCDAICTCEIFIHEIFPHQAWTESTITDYLNIRGVEIFGSPPKRSLKPDSRSPHPLQQNRSRFAHATTKGHSTAADIADDVRNHDPGRGTQPGHGAHIERLCARSTFGLASVIRCVEYPAGQRLLLSRPPSACYPILRGLGRQSLCRRVMWWQKPSRRVLCP